MEVVVSVAGKAFYCKSLSGESGLNPAINADCTVSCNCADSDGTGLLGDLREESLTAIWQGPRASALRQALAAGRVPILRCITCHDRGTLARGDAMAKATLNAVPNKKVLMENTAACSLHCISCRRTSRPLSKMHMSLQEMSGILSQLRDLNVQGLAFYNLGEPFLSRQIVAEMDLVRQYLPNAEVHISTTGMHLTSDKIRAALQCDLIFVSLDGPDGDTAARYQIGINFQQAIGNVGRLVSERKKRGFVKPYIVWRYIVFNWNDKPGQVRHAIAQAQDLGVDAIEFRWTWSPIWGVSLRFHRSAFWRDLAPIEGRSRNIRFKTASHEW